MQTYFNTEFINTFGKFFSNTFGKILNLCYENTEDEFNEELKQPLMKDVFIELIITSMSKDDLYSLLKQKIKEHFSEHENKDDIQIEIYTLKNNTLLITIFFSKDHYIELYATISDDIEKQLEDEYGVDEYYPQANKKYYQVRVELPHI